MLKKEIEDIQKHLKKAIDFKGIADLEWLLDQINNIEKGIENTTVAKMHQWMFHRMCAINREYEVVKRNDWNIAFNDGQLKTAMDFWNAFPFTEKIELPLAEEMIEWIEKRLAMENQIIGNGPAAYSAVKKLCEQFLEEFRPTEELTMENKIVKAKETLENCINCFINKDWLKDAKELQDTLDTLNELTQELEPTRKDRDECYAPKIKHYPHDPWKTDIERKKELGIKYDTIKEGGWE